MKISVEISMYPLAEQYETPILRFIEQLKQCPELSVQTNTMSTQIFGDYEVLMPKLTAEIKDAFLAKDTTIMVMKIVNADLETKK